MKINKLKKAISLTLIAAMLVGSFAMTSFADNGSNVIVNGRYTAEKVSNPDMVGEKVADGLMPGGDRMNSYAWCMEQLGDYIYIGCNRNLMYFGIKNYVDDGKVDMAKLEAALNAVTNGETPIPKGAGELLNAKVFRYNIKTQKMEVYGGAEAVTNFGFRMAKRFKDAIYMNRMTFGADGMVCDIIKITNDSDKPEVINIGGASNLRAMIVSEDGKTFYVGGTKPENDQHDFNTVVYKTTDGVNFEEITQDYDPVFEIYQKTDAGYLSQTGDGDVWDLAEYNGDLYLTMLLEKGSPVFRAHEQADGTYVWKELVGDNTDPSLLEDTHYEIGFGNRGNYAMTPYVYNGKLYFITFSNVMGNLIKSSQAMFELITSEEKDVKKVFESLKGVEAVLENETAVFRMDENDNVEMVVGDKEKCPDEITYSAILGAGFNNDERSSTSYNWRAAVYNGKLYIGTMDSYSVYKYITKLTNGELLDMSDEEFNQQLAYVYELLKALTKKDDPKAIENLEEVEVVEEAVTTEEVTEVEEIAEAYENNESDVAIENANTIIDDLLKVINEIRNSLDKKATVDTIHELLRSVPDAVDNLKTIRGQLEVLREAEEKAGHHATARAIQRAIDRIDAVIAKADAINVDGLRTYCTISETLANNANPGFELYSTTDGINYETVTLNGFNDSFNYGCRTLLPTENGLYLGTANPFYGTQLWKITDGDEKKPEPVDPTKKDDVKTGDQTDYMSYVILSALALAAMITILAYKRRRQH